MNRGPYHWKRHCVSFFDEKPGCCGLIYGLKAYLKKHTLTVRRTAVGTNLQPIPQRRKRSNSGKFPALRSRAIHDGNQSHSSLHRIQFHYDGLTAAYREGVSDGCSTRLCRKQVTALFHIDACGTENGSILWISTRVVFQRILSFIFCTTYRCNHSRPTRG